MEKSKLSLEDIKLGDVVYASSLSNIIDTYITLVDCITTNTDVRGRIAYIGKELNEESSKVLDRNDNIMAIYNSSEEFSDEVSFDE